MIYRNLASVKLPASFFEEPTLDELKANIASFLANSKALAQAEERKERELLEERNEFWKDIKTDAARRVERMNLEDDEREAREAKAREAKAREAKAREAKARETKAREAKAREAEIKNLKEDEREAEAKEAIQARELKERDEFWEDIKIDAARRAEIMNLEEDERVAREAREAEAKEEKEINIKQIKNNDNDFNYIIKNIDDPYNINLINLAGYKRKSKHYKSKHYKSKHY